MITTHKNFVSKKWNRVVKLDGEV